MLIIILALFVDCVSTNITKGINITDRDVLPKCLPYFGRK